MSGPIFGLCSEHISVVFRGIAFKRSHTRRNSKNWNFYRRNSTTSTIAEANNITRSLFVRSRQRSTTYRLQRSSYVALFPCADNSLRLQKEDLFIMFLLFCTSNQAQRPNNVHDVSRKDFLRMFDSLLRISTTKTNAECRCLTSLVGHDGLMERFVQRNTSNWSTHIIWRILIRIWLTPFGNQILIKLVCHVLIKTDKGMHCYTWCCGKLSFP